MAQFVPNWLFEAVFFPKFPFVNGTICSIIGYSGMFCSDSHLYVDGTICSQTDNLDSVCSEFSSLNGTICSIIGNLGL